VVNGSDQRSDWIANLLMLVPLGWLRHGGRVAGSLVAFLISGLCDYLHEAPRLSALFIASRSPG
jgi:hypothetical protein